MRATRPLLHVLLFTLLFTISAAAQWNSYINRFPVDGAIKSTVADLNLDGAPDLATISFSTHEVVIQYALTGGGFGAEQRYTVPVGAIDIQAADVNNDGNIDLVVADRDSNMISVLLNSGTGTFTRHDFKTDVFPDMIALGDFNHDGKVDIAVPNGGYPATTTRRISIYLGNGDGTFRDAFSMVASPARLFAQDVNRDGKVDIVSVSDSTIDVFKGNGDGTFYHSQQISTGGNVVGAALGPLNNDSAPDLVTTTDGFCGHGCGYIEHVDVWLNSGSGSFSHKASYSPAGTESSAPVAIGDLTADTNSDVAYADFYYDPALALFQGNGNGTLAPPHVVESFTNYPQDLLVYDMNGDGRNDLITTESGSSVDIVFNVSYTSACASPNTKSLHANICAPLSGSTGPSSVHLLATGNGPTKVLRMEAWLDGSKVYQTLSNHLDKTVTASAGTHTLSINTYDYFGHVGKNTETFTVSSSTSSCTATGTDRTVTICSPASGGTYASPVAISAAAQDSRSVSKMQVYVDGVLKYQASAKSISTSLAMASGSRKLTVKGWDSLGSFSKTIYITVK